LVYSKKRITEGKKKILAITKKLEKKLIDSSFQKELFETAIESAKNTLEVNELKLSWSLDIPE
jgi:hypothetical protein